MNEDGSIQNVLTGNYLGLVEYGTILAYNLIKRCQVDIDGKIHTTAKRRAIHT